MCGRFTLRTSASVLIQQFGPLTDDTVFAAWLPRYNIAPTQRVLAVRTAPDDNARQGALLQWGLIPSWAKDPKIGNRMINARAETVASKPSFRSAFRRRRCLILADGYYEWQKTVGAKQPYYFHRPDLQPFAFAGLWESWSGDHKGENVTIESCTIITTTPNEPAGEVHDRMPVIFDEPAWKRWLEAGEDDDDQLQAMLCPAADDLLVADPTDTFVNRPSNEGPACIEPL